MTTLTFVAPLPGLGSLTDFELHQVGGSEGLFTLQAAAAPDKKLFVLDAGTYLPDYQPRISDDQAASIRAGRPEDLATLVIAHHQNGVTTVNLLAPIVVNTAEDICAQIILEGQDYEIKSALVPA